MKALAAGFLALMLAAPLSAQEQENPWCDDGWRPSIAGPAAGTPPNYDDYMGACRPLRAVAPVVPAAPRNNLVVLVGKCSQHADWQLCFYRITWNSSALATGYMLQQRLPAVGDWYDNGAVPTVAPQLDTINGDGGNRQICWRILATNADGRSGPSNEVCLTTPKLMTIPKGRLQ